MIARTIALLVLAAVTLSPAAAQKGHTIKIDDPRWEQLTKTQQDELIAKLKSAGAIDAADKIVYVPPKKNVTKEKTLDILALIPGISSLICGKKNNQVLSQCAERSGADATKCRDAEKARVSKVRSICGD